MTTTLATLRWIATLATACALATLSATSARAAMGLTVLPATTSDGPVTVFYLHQAKTKPKTAGNTASTPLLKERLGAATAS